MRFKKMTIIGYLIKRIISKRKCQLKKINREIAILINKRKKIKAKIGYIREIRNEITNELR